MDYTVEQFADKSYHIKTELDGKKIEFNVVCAVDESEIPGLVEHHINFLNSPAPAYPQQAQPSVQDVLAQQQAQIEALKAEVAALKGV